MKQKHTTYEPCRPQERRRTPLRQAGALALALAAMVLTPAPAQADPPPPHGVIAASIGVEQLTTGNAPSDVIVTNQLAVGDFRIRPTANRGDYDIQIGEDLTDDVSGGVIITSVSEHTRDQGESGQLAGTAPNQFPGYDPGPHVATAHFEAQAAGSYFLPVAYTLPNSLATSVIEFNMNVAAAWFPYDRYLGMYVGNADGANGGVNDTKLAGSEGLTVGTHFIDDNVAPLGDATVNLTSLGINANTDGVLLVLGAKNEDNYALSRVNADGTWTLFSKDNGTDGTAYERDPFAFVFIPKTNQHLISGRFGGDAAILLTSTNTAEGDFTVAALEEGRWELKVNGGSPDKGVLIISPEGGLALNRDNIVTYQANDARDGWIIESRDLPDPSLPPLETPGTEPVASFVYIAGSSPGFLVSPANNLFTSEDGTTTTFTVALETKPKADVTVNISSSNVAEGTVDLASITFTTNDWNIAQTITVTGVDDTNTDGPVTYNIVLAAAASEDPDYNGRDPVDPVVVNIDNDGALVINPTGGLTTTEVGGTATFTMRLTQAPTADVTIALSSSDPTEGTVSPDSFVFTSANWDQDQVATITGTDDFVDDGDVAYTIVTGAAVSADAFFNGRNASDVTVLNTDDDTVGVVVTPTSGLTAVESAGAAFYTIVLRSEPTADVVITTQSSNPSEGTVAPATFTFNAGNWNIEQTFTVTGVDDLVLDGNVTYFVTNSLSSTDPLYAPIDPQDVEVTTLDDEAILTLPATVAWGAGMPGVGLGLGASIFDPNSPDYAGSTLRVAITGGGSADDRLEIRNDGTNPGQIGVSGSTVTYEGTAIGTFAGGQGTTALVVTLNAAATPTATEALLRAVTFRNVAAELSFAPRTLEVTLTDAGGAVATASTTIRVGLLRVTEFQEGADFGHGVYTGAKDIELNEATPDFPFPTGRNANGLFIDNATPNSGQVLLRFDNLVGTGPNQIPTNSIIVAAELFLDINESGNGSPLHRMLVEWDSENATWNSVGFGIIPDDVTARIEADSQFGDASGVGATTAGKVSVSVTPDVEAWVNGGAPNYGWVMPAWPGNSTSISPSEAANVADRPRLRVLWLPEDSATVASFRQDVDGYTGTRDTRIRENAPDTDFSTVTSTFVDALVSGSDPNMEQVLIRFEDIFGSEPGQIPPGSRIDAAALDLASIGSNAVGDGGMFFPLYQPWPEVWTWNGFVNGVETNGVEAAATPSATIGNASLNPDAQAGFHVFEFTQDVQAWSSGTRPNAGWVIIPWPGGGNGWAVRMSEIGVERERPRLRVYYSEGSGAMDITLQQPAFVAGAFQLNFTAAPNGSFSVYRASEVTGPWTKIGDATTNAAGNGTFMDSSPLSSAAFYQVASP